MDRGEGGRREAVLTFKQSQIKHTKSIQKKLTTVGMIFSELPMQFYWFGYKHVLKEMTMKTDNTIFNEIMTVTCAMSKYFSIIHKCYNRSSDTNAVHMSRKILVNGQT